MGGANPFELEKHASLYVMPNTIREPSIYVSDDSEYANAIADLSLNDTQRHDPQPSFQQPQPLFQAQQPPPQGPSQPPQTNGNERPYSLSEFADTDPESFTPQPTTIAEMPRQPSPLQEPPPSFQDDYPRAFQHKPFLPPAPTAPSPQVMEGQASSEQVKEELRRMAMSLSDHLNQANTYLSGLPIRRASTTRVESIGDTP
ncbi:hypothetical protein CEP54_003288 [Fusarium duplospermum]|uniref:Uncharacterized protein n=1 Tax=Fusarium duplospermum TaxID=1325734 RepID=A0A428QQD2_9HYPO|nr:hypothetical protein CEP54_003288 [Fusarium duplospermum]